MSVFGSSPILPSTAAQSLAGLNQAERANKQNSDAKKTTKPDGRKRAADAVEIDVQSAQSSDAIRNLTANGDEETTEERQEQDHYDPHKDPAAKAPRLDVQG
jgi:hypothetical protein